MAVNPDDDEALRRIINYPARGIGETTMKKLTSASTQHQVSLWGILTELDKYDLGVNGGTKKKLESFKKLIEEFIDENVKDNAYELGQLIYNRTGILASLAHDSTPEAISKQENLQELLGGLKDFVDQRLESGEEDISMRAFLSEVMLATDQDKNDDTDQPKVTLMTVHAAKGLEFKHVYIVGVEEELFPSAMSMDSMEQIEEERRLLYVAITRAEKSCTITYAGSRFRNGQTMLSRPSRFLSDIDPQYLNLLNSSLIGDDSHRTIDPRANYYRNTVVNNRPSYNTSNSYNRTPRSNDTPDRLRTNSRARATHKSDSADVSKLYPGLKRGVRIEHSKFGVGTVVALSQVSGDPSITVDFGILGEKKLLLRFAKFTILED